MSAFAPCPCCGRPRLVDHACPRCQPSGRRATLAAVVLGAGLAGCGQSQALYGVMDTDPPYETDTETPDSDDTDPTDA